MKVVIPMRKALADPQVLAHALPGKSWMAWRTLLIAIAGERLNAAERKIYKSLTSRPKESGRMVDLFLGVIGRRGGKSKAAAVFMTWLATCCDWTDVLSLGERGIALIIAPTERQARVTEDYIRAIIDSSPLLASLIEDRTTHVLTLSRQVGIEVLAANAKTAALPPLESAWMKAHSCRRTRIPRTRTSRSFRRCDRPFPRPPVSFS
jgi:hypothetical protein